MGFLTKIFSSGAEGIINGVKGIVDEFHLSSEEKQKFTLELESLLQKRDSEIEQTIRTELDAKSKIIQAEMAQGDNFTKRARPMVVYVGLGVIVLNYCIAPLVAVFIGKQIPELILPTEFWVAWGGIVATWSIGRSSEKRGARDVVTTTLTGNKAVSLLD